MHRIDPMKRERATAVLVDFCHTKLRFRKIKIFWALPWKNLRLLMWPKNPISSYFGQNSEMQNCQDYSDPTVVSFTIFCVWQSCLSVSVLGRLAERTGGSVVLLLGKGNLRGEAVHVCIVPALISGGQL